MATPEEARKRMAKRRLAGMGGLLLGFGFGIRAIDREHDDLAAFCVGRWAAGLATVALTGLQPR